DFGGQEIMTATHQFFLTKRCVYILVLDARKDDNTATQIRQWVKRIKATGGNVAIIVVANQVDINTAFGFDNEFELQQEFPQIKAFIKASCKTSENIERIKDELAELIPQADLFNTEIDERWMHIKDQLQKETKQKFFLDENRFTEICQANELADKAGQHNAITFLHDLGLVLHFEDLSKELSEFFVLDPYWITYGVYQILTSKRAGEVNGRVPMEQLEYIVNEEEAKEAVYQPKEHKKITYTKSQREFLVDILHEFKLCFRSPDRCEFILPDLLPTKEPEIITHPLRTDSEAIRFVYQYDYLPNSLMPRIIVETHRLQQESWRTGCVLGYNGSMALISAYQSRISLTVSGEPRKKYEFMAIIRHLLDTINSTLSDQPDMLIPLPGTTEFADYEELLERERDGERDYTIYKPVKKKFNISELLQGVASQYEIAMLSRQVDILTDKVDDVQESLDRYFEKLMQNPANARLKEDILNALQENSIAQIKEINREIIDFLAVCFEHLHGDIDSELQEIYAKLHKTSNVQMKLKLAVPLLNLLGVKFETEVDLKGWAKKMDKKYKMPLFKSLGLLS
ncbi:hypothetical protein KC799_06380, partial [candidate division KSB1 bacterium]|nr:hypothetical protein [candidate division KSB1 bacterium]